MKLACLLLFVILIFLISAIIKEHKLEKEIERFRKRHHGEFDDPLFKEEEQND